MRLHLAPVFAILLLLPHVASAEFLVGNGAAGDRIYVLCEGETRAFVSHPGGEMESLALDDGGQAYFVPASEGPYSVQCGSEVETIAVRAKAAGREDWLLAEKEGWAGRKLAVGVSFFIFAIALALVVAHFRFYGKGAFLGRLLGKTAFTKTVLGGEVTLAIESDNELLFVEIEDAQLEGGKLEVPKIAAGKEWSFSYESEGAITGAKMSANERGKRIVMDARLMVDGKERGRCAAPVSRKEAGNGEKAGGAPLRRKLERAEG